MTRLEQGPPAHRGDRLLPERGLDPYRERKKPSEPSRCPDCGAEYRDGRWRWASLPAIAAPHLCPACRRIRDDYPGGTLSIRGAFTELHNDEILALARHSEERERAEHPLQRIMDVRRQRGATVIRTTDAHLARGIGEALLRAYHGRLHYDWGKEGAVLRVTWTR